jgi:hypothetical protein
VAARRLGGGGRGERAARWRRLRQADAMVQASGAVEHGVGNAGGVVRWRWSMEGRWHGGGGARASEIFFRKGRG